MRYTRGVSRFLITLPINFQVVIAACSVVFSLISFICIPALHSFTMIFILPVILVSWMFQRRGLFACVVAQVIILWLYYSLRTHSFLLSQALIIGFLLNILVLVCVGLAICYQRSTLDMTEASRSQLLKIAAQQAQLNEIKDQFLQNVNHELRTPLTAIYGYLELLHEHDEQLDPAMRTSFLQNAMQSCDELQLLVNNVLDTMGMEKSRVSVIKEEIVVRDVVLEVLERFDPKSVQHHCISVDIPDYIVVYANSQYLRQVIRNLLSNAFKYVPGRTVITIRAALYGSVVDPYHASPEICIQIQDQGPGIPQEDISLLFGQFVRLLRDTSGSIRGSGLGLFLCKQFVEAMDGRIWVESTGLPGDGATFKFTLPAVLHPHILPQTTALDFEPFRVAFPQDTYSN